MGNTIKLIFSGDLAKAGSVVKVATFNIGQKSRGKSWVVFIALGGLKQI